MTQSTAQSSNPLLNIGFKIPFDQIRPEHAEPAVDELLAAARERVENLARSGERNFENFMADLDTLTEQLGTVNTIVHHLDSVVSSDEWKAATEAIIPKTTQFYTELSLHPGLWGRSRRLERRTPPRGSTRCVPGTSS